MRLTRSCCALVVSLVAACSFPTYQVDGSGTLMPSCRNGLRDTAETGVDCGPGCDPCPACSDGMLNGQETEIDCGGSCAPCPTCQDGRQNGSESDADCGGTCGLRCDTNQRCRENADCSTLVCLSVCQPSDCKDGVRL